MPKPERGTPKWIATQWKKKGMSKLRWHCGLCGVSCIDGNGFKMHLEHPNHLRRELEQEAVECERADNVEARYLPDAFSEAFERNYLRYLATEKVGQRVKAHEAYRVLHPDDRRQDNMHKTCWGTLGRFIVDLRERGEIAADREGNGWTVTMLEDAPAASWAGLSDNEARLVRNDDANRIKRGWNECEDENRTRAKRRRHADDLEAVMERAARAAADAGDAADAKAPPAAAAPSGLARAVGKVAFGFASTAPPPSRADAAPPPTAAPRWARSGLVVKARAGKTAHGGAFDKVKCAVLAARADGRVDVETLDGGARAALPEDKLETVIPALGRDVRLVLGDRAGQRATLLALRIDDFAADVKLPDGTTLEKVPYEHICRER